MSSTPFEERPPPVPQSSIPSTQRAAPIKGMSLGGKSKNKTLEDSLLKEDKLAPMVLKSKVAQATVAEQAIIQPVVQHPVMMVISERVSCKMTSDGEIQSFDIKGSLTLTAANDEAALCTVQLRQDTGTPFKFQTHPNVNKATYEKEQLLQLKDPSKGFPSSRPVGVLKWTYSSTVNEEMIPIKINCWPEEESKGHMNVSIEYNMDMKNIVLHDVNIVIPLATSAIPQIQTIDGNYKHNSASGELTWEVSVIDTSNASGSLEFSIQQRDSEAFFPIHVSFASKELYCNVDVVSVKSIVANTPIQYGLTRSMNSDEYIIG